jgi:hypothetical protein
VKVSTEYEVLSSTGQPLFTTPEIDLARKWARERAAVFPGLRVEAVERTEIRRRVWSYRQHLRVVSA